MYDEHWRFSHCSELEELSDATGALLPSKVLLRTRLMMCNRAEQSSAGRLDAALVMSSDLASLLRPPALRCDSLQRVEKQMTSSSPVAESQLCSVWRRSRSLLWRSSDEPIEATCASAAQPVTKKTAQQGAHRGA